MSVNFARLIVFSSAILLGGIATTRDSGQAASSPDVSANLFRERVAAYMQTRQEIVADLLENGLDPSADSGREFRETLAAAIQKARRNSKRGDVLSPVVAGRMRQIVWSAVSSRPQLYEEEILPEVPQVPVVRVNDFYPAGEPLATVPPQLLQQLDPLPPELQYRFLASALILLDIDTALIVDFIPDAFPATS